MPKVHKLTAGKDYPDHGISKGDTYYKWKLYRRPVQRSIKPPTRSQLTGSPWLSQLYALQDAEYTAEDVQEVAQNLHELSSEAQEALDNMPESLQEGDTGQILQARAESAYNVASELEGVEQEEDESDEDFSQRISEILDQVEEG